MSTAQLTAYRKIGPFSETTLPQGLLAGHRLKAGSWGRLTLLAGSISFVWDDTGVAVDLCAGDEQLIPPLRQHHLEIVGAVELEIEFLREN